MLSQDTFPEDMADMVVMAVAMEDMEVTVMERGRLKLKLDMAVMAVDMVVMEDMEAMAVDMAVMARGRPKLDMAVMAVAMVVMAVAMEAMEEDIMVNCYNYFSFPPLTITINWPQDTKVE